MHRMIIEVVWRADGARSMISEADLAARSATPLWRLGFVTRGDHALERGFALVGEPAHHVVGDVDRARDNGRSERLDTKC